MRLHPLPPVRRGRLACAAAILLIALGCGNDGDELILVGTVEYTLVELVAPTHEVIVAVEVTHGERVEAGKVLVRLDPTLAEAEIARAEAAVSGAQTAVVTAEHELERRVSLHQKDVASVRMLELAQLERSEARARLREAKALLAVAHKRRRDLDVHTPVAGVVDQIPYDPGERVPAGSVLAVVIERAEPWVRVWVPQPELANVAPGSAAEVRVDGIEGPLRASVLDIAREPEFTPHYALTERDRVHLVYESRVRIHDAPSALRPGAPAEVHLGSGVATGP